MEGKLQDKTKELDLFSKEFADNLDVLRRSLVEIDERLGKDAAYQVK